MILTGGLLPGYSASGKETSMAKIYRVDLSKPERGMLLALLQKGRDAARKVRRAQILLAAADGQSDATIARVLHSSVSTVERTRKHFIEGGLDAALHERPRPGARRKLTGKQEALLVALACSEPPAGRTRWTMQLLANRVVELGLIEAISDETIRRALKKTRSNLG
jgi:transposase